MTYRCGIGPRLAEVMGLSEARSVPGVYCDHAGCRAFFEAKVTRGGPPSWLRNNRAPKGWRMVREGERRRDFCPEHKGDAGASP